MVLALTVADVGRLLAVVDVGRLLVVVVVLYRLSPWPSDVGVSVLLGVVSQCEPSSVVAC